MRYKFSVRCPSTETWISIREVEWDNLRTFGHCELNHAMLVLSGSAPAMHLSLI